MMKTDVVLLPGMHGTTALFQTFVSLAPSWARCLPVALPEESSQSFEAIASRILPTVCGLEQIVLVAESFSGPVAAHLSRSLGPKVALLVLCNPLVRVDAPVYPGLGARLATSRWVPEAAVAWLMTGGDRSIAREMLGEVRRAGRQVMEGRIASALGATAEQLVQDFSGGLVIVGTRDRLLPPARTLEVFGGVPYTTLFQIEAPHLVVQTHPAQVWEAISEEFRTAA